MATHTSRLLSSPHFFPYAFDFERRALRFAHVTREAMHAAAFHDTRLIRTQRRFQSIALDRWLAAPRPPSAAGPVHFLAYTPYAGSTLLSRLLDVVGRIQSVREPWTLSQLRRLYCSTPDSTKAGAWQDAVQALLHQLAKRFHPGEVTLLKPMAFDYVLAEQLYTAYPAAKTVFLYQSLDDHLVSLLKRPKRRRAAQQEVAWLRHIGDPFIAAMGNEPLSDARAIGAQWVWLVHRFAGRRHQGAAGDATRLRTLSATTFQQEPQAALAAIGRFLDLGVSDEVWADIVAGPRFSGDAKQLPGGAIGRRLRQVGWYMPLAPWLRPANHRPRTQSAQSDLKTRFAADIDATVAWVRTMGHGYLLDRPLPQALL